jgi:hypothetical protein
LEERGGEESCGSGKKGTQRGTRIGVDKIIVIATNYVSRYLS